MPEFWKIRIAHPSKGIIVPPWLDQRVPGCVDTCCCVHLLPSSDNKRSEKRFAERWGHLGEQGDVSLEQSKSESTNQTLHQHQKCAGAGAGAGCGSVVGNVLHYKIFVAAITIANEAIFTLTCPSPSDGSSSGSTSDRGSSLIARPPWSYLICGRKWLPAKSRSRFLF